MLEEAVAEVQLANELGVDPSTGELRRKPDDDWVPVLNTGIAVYIPEDYVEALDVRLGLYRRVGMLRTKPDLDAFLVEVDARGRGPLDRLPASRAELQPCRAASAIIHSLTLKFENKLMKLCRYV